MKVSFAHPEQELVDYVAQIWVFESRGGIPLTDSRLIVPDGRAKIILPYKSAVCATVGGQRLNGKQEHVFLVGIQSNPVTIASTSMVTGTIGIELTPKALYRLFRLNMRDLTNSMVGFEDIFGSAGARLQQWIGQVDDPQSKIKLLQGFLSQRLHQEVKDYSVLDHVVDAVTQAQGMISVRKLETQTGYTKRYLDMLFREHVGPSPKSLATILRFQSAYRSWMRDKAPSFAGSDLLGYYYDQSHFIREFKRFTGFTPYRYRQIVNEFGKAFAA